ncbi:MAG: GNAT family N-acetyltransferase [Kangiellaceae bacterium]|jgi:ribosomal protein S18 acetylase RimI-like enzyme|nr:GNAT family N-acetyltransferase [Kangiellaceae bacterium]
MSTPSLQIVPYTDKYAVAFKQLNTEWLERYFEVEPIDHKVLSNPQQSIIEPGGWILMALLEVKQQHKPVGTVALINAGNGRLELSKMAVTDQLQGQGIGKKLLLAAIESFLNSDYQSLFLESNSALKPAIGLYEAMGFFHTTKPDGDSHYARADVYMEYRQK